MFRILISLVSLLLLASCASESDTFRLEGRLMKIRQADFFIYSTDGGITGRDTINVMDGRFAYETKLTDKKTFVIVFPNHSEQPVFAEPGATVKIDGNASQLREMEIEGTADNELYTEFRQETLNKSESEMKEAAEQFITEHPTSMVCRYLIDKYFIKTSSPDYRKAENLVDIVLAADPDHARFQLLKKQLGELTTCAPGDTLPRFEAVSVYGDTITLDSLRAKVNVVSVYAAWHATSQTINNTLRSFKKDNGDSIAIMNICLDADTTQNKRKANKSTVRMMTVCDGMAWDSPLLKTFGFNTMAGNIIADKTGKIIAVDLNNKDLSDKINSLLK